MKNLIVVTGGAGFVGSNLIDFLLKKTKYKIISLDNYSSGNKKNHNKNSRVKYLKGETSNIYKILDKKKKKLKPFFTLENSLEFFKALKNLMNVLNQTRRALKLYLNFV